ncbi:MAG: hypothetical protein Q9212_005519 [Teloschistes hypoglaucus]
MEPIASMSEAQVNHLAHYRLHYATALVWINTGKVMAALQSLKTLTLDVEQAYCTEGCCRKCQIIVECFRGINGGRKKDNLPPVEIQIAGALDEDEEYLLALCIAGDFGEEDDSHEASNCDALENNQEDDETEIAENNLLDGEAGRDSDRDDYNNDDASSTNSSSYDDGDYTLNKREYVEYGPEEEEVTASRKRYICARFDRDTESPQGLSALSPLAQLHRTADMLLATVRAIYRPYLLRPSHNFVWQQSLGMSIMRTSERRFAQQMIYASHPYYLVNHPFQQSYEDPQSQYEAPCCMYKRLREEVFVQCEEHRGQGWPEDVDAIREAGFVDEMSAEEWQGRYSACRDLGRTREKRALGRKKNGH